jgi:hypothetical protein
MNRYYIIAGEPTAGKTAPIIANKDGNKCIILFTITTELAKYSNVDGLTIIDVPQKSIKDILQQLIHNGVTHGIIDHADPTLLTEYITTL